MNVGIVTFHCSYNFGSALQAWAMQTIIEKLGHRATIVDYRSRNFDAYRLMRVCRPKTMLKLLRSYGRNKARKDAFEGFWAKWFNLSQACFTYRDEKALASLVECFDCFVCGSDQIWNLDCTQGVVEPFFLSFAGDNRRVAYAPSLAHTTFNPENFDKEQVASLLTAFDYLSVREAETLPLFQPLVDKPIDVVLDPTLLLSAVDYEGIVSSSPVDGDYIFSYLLRECPQLVESTTLMAREMRKKVVYVSEVDLPIPGGVNLFGVGPSEFLSLIANADAILANSFHAAVFSVLFHKPFRVFATDNSGTRMWDLLDNLGIGERCVDGTDSTPIADVDWDDVERRLDILRTHSLGYLRKALS